MAGKVSVNNGETLYFQKKTFPEGIDLNTEGGGRARIEGGDSSMGEKQKHAVLQYKSSGPREGLSYPLDYLHNHGSRQKITRIGERKEKGRFTIVTEASRGGKGA